MTEQGAKNPAKYLERGEIAAVFYLMVNSKNSREGAHCV